MHTNPPFDPGSPDLFGHVVNVAIFLATTAKLLFHDSPILVVKPGVTEKRSISTRPLENL